ncbi:MAG: hypothetical protein K9W45_02055 [Candidatus Heimdallarchaeum aukensis]|uniref:Uncharacterized protein n=1 Tax=Candidatus Heimdallarchaeum aukensis TaxID=2876573 RepID=A0A9Y1BLV4_9ARCH|nr:MAG: hypothetical protein K9W45_02055 [Candidatus Heimdallarchaeum aukensis]
MDLNFVVSLTIAIFMFILGIIFIVQSIIKKRTAYVFTSSMFIGMIASLIEVFRVSKLPNLDFNSSVLLVIHLSFWCLMYLLSLIFFIQLEKEKILSYILPVVMIIYVLHITFGIFWIYSGSFPDQAQSTITMLWDLTYALMGILTFSYGAYVHFKTGIKAHEKEGYLLGGALILISIGFLLGFIKDLGVKVDIQSIPVGEVLKLIGIFTFIIFYIAKPDYIFRLPFQITSVLVFNRLGMLIYSAQYLTEDGDEEIDPDDTSMELITAAVNAFSTFMKETTGSEEPLKRVKTGDKLLIVEQGDKCSIAIISTSSSYFMIQSMRKVIKELEKRYEKELELDYTDSTFFNEVPKLISYSFPFLGIPKKELY